MDKEEMEINANEDELLNIRMCNYCHEKKLIPRYRRYCLECNEHVIVERRKRKHANVMSRNILRYELQKKELEEDGEKALAEGLPDPRLIKKMQKCRKCDEMVEFPKWYCKKCYDEIENQRKKKVCETAKKRYHVIKDKLQKEEADRREYVKEMLENKYKNASENLCRKELLNLITEYFDKLTDIEDLRYEVRMLYEK